MKDREPDHEALPTSGLQHVTTFCGQCSCGCPELYLDPAADEERRVVITDDFGSSIRMSLAQLAVIVDDARDGVLDDLLGVAGGSSAPLRAAGAR
ncbi:hypothetical protein EV188_111119 [Actinomycetospora succinea]|uniref:Uncharacterized protein n=1 Tax=Actinomycetospora succinea TaxID=663603 RepID=A0A4R6USZ9_9PSEU|nr:hypothetical protein [Actinomycetospora succinea]TDQ48949.1 hypothetical protein EV188_111119 [Actinomycetospora succinea]